MQPEAILDEMQSWLAGKPVATYADILQRWGPMFEMYRIRWRVAGYLADRADYLEKSAALWLLRDHWIARYGFAIPCAELLDELAKADQVIDVGAGTGYMTLLMRYRGIDVIGSDHDMSGHGFRVGRFDAGQAGAAAKTMVRRHPKATVFCSWPTYRATWFRQMLKAMRIGQRLIVIREDACAEETAWQYLDDCFAEEGQIYIPTFPNMNDYAGIYLKKRQRGRDDGR